MSQSDLNYKITKYTYKLKHANDQEEARVYKKKLDYYKRAQTGGNTLQERIEEQTKLFDQKALELNQPCATKLNPEQEERINRLITYSQKCKEVAEDNAKKTCAFLDKTEIFLKNIQEKKCDTIDLQGIATEDIFDPSKFDKICTRVESIKPQKQIVPFKNEGPISPKPNSPTNPLKPYTLTNPYKPNSPTNPLKPHSPTNSPKPHSPTNPLQPNSPTNPLQPNSPTKQIIEQKKITSSNSPTKLTSPQLQNVINSPQLQNLIKTSKKISPLNSPKKQSPLKSPSKTQSPTIPHKTQSPTIPHKTQSPTVPHKTTSPISPSKTIPINSIKHDNPTVHHKIQSPTKQLPPKPPVKKVLPSDHGILGSPTHKSEKIPEGHAKNAPSGHKGGNKKNKNVI